MRETWYILEDGSAAHPHAVKHDAHGVLRHKDGRAVAYAPHGPRTRSVDPEAERARGRTRPSPSPAPEPEPEPDAEIDGDDPDEPGTEETREMRPARRGRRYKTRS